ncbi:MAG: class I SAM-dependent methyltransferase [Chthoniobacterales bacterium]|nr:class I SAM-dependent methyltransferase [Chthoniobacterales bacterium]
MQLSHKLKKLLNPEVLRSARQHIGVVILTKRFVFALDKAIFQAIDREKFQAIYDRHAIEDPGDTWPKYLDLRRWIRTNLQRIRALDLDWGRRKRVLDIGSGAGYFLFICKWLGHEPLGLDIDELPMYGEMTQMLGIPRVIWRVKAFEPLPHFEHRFDLITAFMICFHGHKSQALWGPKEWEFFLDDLETRLKPGGRIALGFNRENDGAFYPEAVRQYFLQRDGEIDEQRVTFTPR